MLRALADRAASAEFRQGVRGGPTTRSRPRATAARLAPVRACRPPAGLAEPLRGTGAYMFSVRPNMTETGSLRPADGLAAAGLRPGAGRRGRGSMPIGCGSCTRARSPVLVAGTFAVNCYTGINRPTKDLDIFCKAGRLPAHPPAFQGARLRHRDRGRALDREGPSRRLLLRRDLRLGRRGRHGHRPLVPGEPSGRALRRAGAAHAADRDDLVEGAAAEPPPL